MVLEYKSLMVKISLIIRERDGVANPEKHFHLYVDDYDKVWVGTYGGGVGYLMVKHGILR